MGLLTSNRSNSNRSNRSEVRGMPPSAQRQLSNGDTAFRMHLSAKDKIEQQQLKTWLRWWNSELPEGHRISEQTGLVAGIASGVACCMLLEKLTGEKFPPRARMGALNIPEAERTGASYNMETAGNRIKMIENQCIFLSRVRALGIGLTNISEEDLVDGRQTLILGLTWKLITHFSGGLLSDAQGSELLDWVRRNVASHGVEVASWADLSDGVCFCALLHAYDPTCLDFETVRLGGTPYRNLELAFRVAEGFGAPRLLDASDVSGVAGVEGGKGGKGYHSGGEGAGAEELDARSLQTYTLKLSQALRVSAESWRAGVGDKLAALAAKAEELNAWVEVQAGRVRSQAKEMSGAKGQTSSAGERTALMERAEALDAQLVAFREGEREERARSKQSVEAQVAALRSSVEAEVASGFDHGGALAAVEASLVPQLDGIALAVSNAWAALDAAEAEVAELLGSILIHKTTDRKLAAAELEVAALSEWAGGQVYILSAALPAAEACDSIKAVAQAGAVLAAWAAAAEAMAEREARLQAALAEVASRRSAETREPITADGSEELAALWQAMTDAASSLRRSVGSAAKAQAEQVAQLVASWKDMSAGLSARLPEDELLQEPPSLANKDEPGCAIM